jgi:hypothetical protein
MEAAGVAAGVALYAISLNVDLADAKRRRSHEVENRQRVEKYLAETRDQLTQKVREIEQLKAQLDCAQEDYRDLSAHKPQLPVVIIFRPSWLTGRAGHLQSATRRSSRPRTHQVDPA